MKTDPKSGTLASASQLDKFKAAARELGTDDDPERFRETIRKLAKAPPTKQVDRPKTERS